MIVPNPSIRTLLELSARKSTPERETTDYKRPQKVEKEETSQ
jgi:hypothetical protein